MPPRRPRAWRCAGRRTRRRASRRRRTATRRSTAGSSRLASSGPTSSASRPMPLARLTPRRKLEVALGARGDPQAADGLEHPELGVELDAVAAKAHHRLRRVELRDEAGCVMRRPARQLALLDQHDVRHARLGEVVRAAHARRCRLRSRPWSCEPPARGQHYLRYRIDAWLSTTCWRPFRSYRTSPPSSRSRAG